MTTPDAALMLATAIAEARRQALAVELRPWIAEARALVAVASGVRALAQRALAPPTTPVDTPAPATDRGPRIGRGNALARGPIVGEVIVSTPLDPLLSLKALASYSGLSVRKLRDCLDDPVRPLPHYRVGGKILVKRSDFDTWAIAYRQIGRADVDRIVGEVLADLRAS